MAKGYKSQRYEGLPHFQCEDCPFDTFDEEAMREHVQDDQHMAPRYMEDERSHDEAITPESAKTKKLEEKPGGEQ